MNHAYELCALTLPILYFSSVELSLRKSWQLKESLETASFTDKPLPACGRSVHATRSFNSPVIVILVTGPASSAELVVAQRLHRRELRGTPGGQCPRNQSCQKGNAKRLGQKEYWRRR